MPLGIRSSVCVYEYERHDPTEHDCFVKDPLKVPSVHVRVWLVHVPPHATEDAWYAVTLAPCAKLPPQGFVQLLAARVVTLQLSVTPPTFTVALSAVLNEPLADNRT